MNITSSKSISLSTSILKHISTCTKNGTDPINYLFHPEPEGVTHIHQPTSIHGIQTPRCISNHDTIRGPHNSICRRSNPKDGDLGVYPLLYLNPRFFGNGNSVLIRPILIIQLNMLICEYCPFWHDRPLDSSCRSYRPHSFPPGTA